MPATIVVLSIGSRTSDSVTVSTVTTTTVTGFTNAWSVVLSATVPSTTKIGDKLTTGANSYLIVNISGSTLTVIGDASAAFTSTTTPATGAATTARTYSTISGWDSGAPSSLLTQNSNNGWVWKGELYKEGAGTNNEWTVTAKITLYGASVATDSTRYMWLAAASGASFADNASKLTNALRYNAANGVAVRMTGTQNVFEIANGITAYFTGLQIKGAGASAFNGFNSGGLIALNQCIVCSDDTNPVLSNIPVIQVVNCLFYNTGTVLSWSTTARQYLYACTIYSTSTTVPLLSTNNSDGNLYDNAFFGGSAVASASTYFVASNNATNQSSVGFGSSNQASLTTSNQFESVTAGSEDFRVKTGAALINNGIRQQTYTNDLDIVGSARSTTTPTIGAWEYAAAATPIYEFQSFNRGIGRGIARGIA